MVVPLHTDVADPASRLAAVYASTTAAKELQNAVGARTLTDLSQVIPAATAALAGRMAATMEIRYENTPPPYNTVVTNVPGPQQPLYMAGARMVASYGFGMVHDNMGLMNVVTSYVGTGLDHRDRRPRDDARPRLLRAVHPRLARRTHSGRRQPAAPVRRRPGEGPRATRQRSRERRRHLRTSLCGSTRRGRSRRCPRDGRAAPGRVISRHPFVRALVNQRGRPQAPGSRHVDGAI